MVGLMTGEPRVAFNEHGDGRELDRRSVGLLRLLRSMHLRDGAPQRGYPFDLPAIAALGNVEFAPVTVFVGENGSGKSTIVEALASSGSSTTVSKVVRSLFWPLTRHS